VGDYAQSIYSHTREVLTKYVCSGMEIHEYMSAKGAFMMKMLRISNRLTDAEIEDIRRATSSALRMAPIGLGNLVMREFVIGDVHPLLQAGLAPTVREAEDLVVTIIRDAGMAKRKHAELAILARENREGGGDTQLVGRVGVRIIEDVTDIAPDGPLMRVLDALPTGSKRTGHIVLLYVFFDPSRDDTIIAKNALDAFVLGLADTVQKNDCEQRKATNTDSETVWHLLEGCKLTQVDHSNVKGGTIFQIDRLT
jgi:hypothetical protein